MTFLGCLDSATIFFCPDSGPDFLYGDSADSVFHPTFDPQRDAKQPAKRKQN